ncbi:MAG: HAD family hydrolase [Candidatus Poribacteria bacterium]|nr:HAD family hydrolase [Candidatus Poribacteria bacterium]
MANQSFLIKMHRGVFFDLYGTLLVFNDVEAAGVAGFEALYERFEQHGIKTSFEAFRKRAETSFGFVAPERRDGLTLSERRVHRLAIQMGLVLEADEVREINAAMADAWQSRIELDPEAIPILESLTESGKTLALITNFDHPPHVRKVLVETGLTAYFKTIIVSGEVGVSKPERQIFELALNEAGLRPSETIFVGDTADDANGARVAGIMPLIVRRNGMPALDESEFDMGMPRLISALSELVDAPPTTD